MLPVTKASRESLIVESMRDLAAATDIIHTLDPMLLPEQRDEVNQALQHLLTLANSVNGEGSKLPRAVSRVIRPRQLRKAAANFHTHMQMLAVEVTIRFRAEQHAAPGPVLPPQMLNHLNDTDSESDSDEE